MTPDTGLLVLSASDVTSLFDLDAAIESQRVAFRELGLGHAQLPARLVFDGPDESASFCYAARVSDDTGSVCKFGSVVPDNAERGLPTVSAVVTALDPVTGQPTAILDGTTVTTIRTSAASAVAAEHLANPESAELAVLGAGVQAEAHVRALAKVLPLRRVRIWNRDGDRARALVGELSQGFEFDLQACASTEEAVTGADVVACCTNSPTPVLQPAWLKSGATVISVGSYAADRCEVPIELLSTVDAVVVDDVPTALEHAGPVVAAVAAGILAAGDLVALGAVVAGRAVGRRRPDDIVYYNSVGIGVQDAAAAWSIIAAARARGVGRTISL
jgi:ornithine cyclodeaminase/alanine dehydrogenase-like protein (mu-crystallin family)